MVRIAIAINKLLDNGHKPKDIASNIEVSTPMISTWKDSENDFTPRFDKAKNMYKHYGIQIWPYSIEALEED